MSRGKMSLRRKLLLGFLVVTTIIVVIAVPVAVTQKKEDNISTSSSTSSSSFTGENSRWTDVPIAESSANREQSFLAASNNMNSTSGYSSASSLAPTATTTDTSNTDSSRANSMDELNNDMMGLSDNSLSNLFDGIQNNDTNITLNNTNNATSNNVTNAALIDDEIIVVEFSDPPTLFSTLSPTTDPPTTTLPTNAPTAGTRIPRITREINSYNILETIPHDTNAFTQGLTFDPLNPNLVYESTGIYGQSDVRHVNIETGEVLLLKESPASVFGEGLAYYTTNSGQGRLIHITWKSRRGFIFEADTLEVVTEFQFSTTRNEGWGITFHADRNQFFVTDGSSNLHVWDRNLQEVERIPVKARFGASIEPVLMDNLNEIEWDATTDTILANVWRDDIILRIDPATGEVLTQYNLSDLASRQPPNSDVLNGIAIFTREEGVQDLWITGKLWPEMYRIDFNE